MTHYRFHAITRCALLALIMCVAGTVVTLRAQAPNCCTFSVDVAGLAPCCYPIGAITMEWSNGLLQTFTAAADGVTVQSITIAAPCPPGPTLNWLALPDGTVLNLGSIAQYVDPSTGCCLEIIVKLDPAGCLYIGIRPCPFPPVP